MAVTSFVIAVIFCVVNVNCALSFKEQELKQPQSKRSVGGYGLGTYGIGDAPGLPASLGLGFGASPLGGISKYGLEGFGGGYAPGFAAGAIPASFPASIGPPSIGPPSIGGVVGGFAGGFALGGPSSFGPVISGPAILPQLPATISHNTVTTVQRPFAVPG